jgi:hypothetical protein
MGKRDQKIFLDDSDRLYFINLLQKQKMRSALNIYCYVLLPRQFSLLTETYTNNLSKSMHWINSSYANYFNRRHNRRHKLFKDHYSCLVIESKNFLPEISCCIHLLPKEDGVAESLFQYKWSTLPGYINREKREDWVDYDCILNMFDGDSHTASLNYKKYIKDSQKKQAVPPFKRLRGRTILGSKEFKKEVLNNRHFDEIVDYRNLENLAKKIIDLSTQLHYWKSLKDKRKNFNHTILSRNAAIHFLKKYTDLSNEQISSYFISLNKSSISQMNRRFNLDKEKYKAIKNISNSLDEKIMTLINKT